MRLVDVGHGVPVVVIPGVQGRWEWMRPTVESLARHCRVVTFSLADEPSGDDGAGAGTAGSRGPDGYVEQVHQALAQAGLERAAICGISYGGLVAAAFASRYPEQVSALVLVSALPPSWRPDARIRWYLQAPRLLAPLFCVGSVRLLPEIIAATGGVVAGVTEAARYAWRAVTHPFGPARMARRATRVDQVVQGDPSRVTAPVLIVTGDPALERVVPVPLTLEYARTWPAARVVRLERTGHLGWLTRREAFAALVAEFVNQPGAERRAGGETS